MTCTVEGCTCGSRFAYGGELSRQVAAHVRAAERAIERSDYEKAEQHYTAITQIHEQHGVDHFGRFSLSAVLHRHATQVHRANERRLMNRDTPIRPSAADASMPGSGRPSTTGTQRAIAREVEVK